MAPRLLSKKEFSLTIITSTEYGLEEEYFKPLTERHLKGIRRIVTAYFYARRAGQCIAGGDAP